MRSQEEIMTAITVKPIGFALGAAITGVDLTKPLSMSIKEQVSEAWREHLVLVFPDQKLSPEQMIEFTSSFGSLDPNDAAPYYRDPTHKEILIVTNKPLDGKPSETATAGTSWHSDRTYTLRPTKASFLLCKEKPSVGGDTIFSNMYKAYETLSRPFQEFLDKLEALHDVSLIKGLDKRDPEKVAAMKKLNPPVIHKVIQTHPETGRKCLFVGQRIRSFVGMTEAESAPILSFLNQHAVSLEFTYRHNWSLNDLMMWDNRCTMHIAVPNYDKSQIRYMLRTALLGEEIGRRFEETAKAEVSMEKELAAVS
ncbi:MAG: TauD/TfdA family dioxygenase [Burkholderiales bacterium]|nr:TauD/TfdA family dioxygenase [Burkholderiales bacterium]